MSIEADKGGITEFFPQIEKKLMPAFAIIAWMAAKKKGLGLLLLPVLFIKGFTVLLPAGLGEFLKPAWHFAADRAGMVFYIGLSVLFLVFAVRFLARLGVNSGDSL